MVVAFVKGLQGNDQSTGSSRPHEALPGEQQMKQSRKTSSILTRDF